MKDLAAELESRRIKHMVDGTIVMVSSSIFELRPGDDGDMITIEKTAILNVLARLGRLSVHVGRLLDERDASSKTEFGPPT